MPEPTIPVEKLRERLTRGEPLTVLDVRDDEARAEWSIPGSLHVDAYDSLSRGEPGPVASIALPRDRPVVTVCGAGRTSLVAARALRERGYDAVSLAGGMRAWSLAWNVAEVALEGSGATVLQVRRTGKGCLSYLLASEGEAAVVDASVDASVYVELARRAGARIVRVLDTHVHADHLSRSRALAEATEATLHLPEQDRVQYPHAALREGDVVRFGASRFETLRTPGHTPESACYLLDGAAVLTGDTLFLDAVGRPDLEATRDGARERARSLHRSLTRLAQLAPSTLVLPCHTANPVPFDGVPLVAPLGDVLARLEAVRVPEDSFVRGILARLPEAPPNHATIVALNEAGELPEQGQADLEAGANRCAVP